VGGAAADLVMKRATYWGSWRLATSIDRSATVRRW
jgi:hypothetical protein